MSSDNKSKISTTKNKLLLNRYITQIIPPVENTKSNLPKLRSHQHHQTIQIRRLSHASAANAFRSREINQILQEKLRPKRIDLLLRCVSVSRSTDNREFLIPPEVVEENPGPQLVGKRIKFNLLKHSTRSKTRRKVDSWQFANFQEDSLMIDPELFMDIIYK